MKLSKKVQGMQYSPIRRFNKFGFDAEAKGIKVYHLNIGQPDIETPEVFTKAIEEYDQKVIAYAESGGMNVLHDAIIKYFERYDVHYTRDNLLVTNGGSEALSMIFTTILNEGDNVLIAEPYYTNYSTFAAQAGGFIKPITTKAEDGYHYAKKELIEAAIDEKTKAICCISPGNPTGNVLTLDEMKLICEIAKEHDLWIVSDEVYREFAYDGREVTSFAMLEEYADRVLIVDSVSKRFSACGARIGFIATKSELFMDGAMKIAQGRLCSPTVDQIGAAAMYGLPESYYAEMKAEYEGRRDVVYEELMKIPGVICQKPGGAFYMTAKLPVEDVEDFLMFLLTEFNDNNETVMFAPAQGFYATPGLGKDEMRMAYVLNQKDLRRAVELIRLGLDFAKTNVRSSVFICWGAQAALYYYYGIPKILLPQKLFGVFEQKVVRPWNPLVRGFDELFYAPHSRHTTVDESALRQNKELRILAESAQSGIHIVSTEEGRQIFIMGHQEYDKDTLAKEYWRDQAAGMDTDVPLNYFRNDNPEGEILFRWRGHGALLFSNWLNYYVYQSVPYDIEEIRKGIRELSADLGEE